MSDLLLDLPDCPDAAGLVSPAALSLLPVLTDCQIPEAPDPVFACPPPPLPVPPLADSSVLHIQITSQTDGRHAWQAVESDGIGGWVPTGRAGSDAASSGTEAYEQTGARTNPGGRTYIARRIPGSRKLVFADPRTPFYIQITGTTSPYDWIGYEKNSAGTWAATGESGTATGGDGAYEINEVVVDTVETAGKIWKAQRSQGGKVVFDSGTSSSGDGEGGGGGGGGSGTAAPYWCRIPSGGVAAATGTWPTGLAPSHFVADVFKSSGASLVLATTAATVYWRYLSAAVEGKIVPCIPNGPDAYDAILDSCIVVPLDPAEGGP